LMNRLTLEDLQGSKVAVLNPQLFGTPAKDMIPPDPDRIAMVDDKNAVKDEKELQKLCTALLEQRGYKYMTADNAAIGSDVGWWGHLHKPKGNPFMPDLFVFAAIPRPPLLVELKVRDKYQPGQREMINAGQWKMCSSVESFREMLNTWAMDKMEVG